MSTQDRWGDNDQSTSQRADSEGGLSWILIIFGILMILALFGGGWMFIRAQSMQRVAMMERDRAMQAEMQARMVAEVQLQKQREATEKLNDEQLKNIDEMMAAIFVDDSAAVDITKKLMENLSKSADSQTLDDFVGRDAIFYDRIQSRVETSFLRLMNDYRVAMTGPFADVPPTDTGMVSMVLGKITKVDRSAKVITIEAKKWATVKP